MRIQKFCWALSILLTVPSYGANGSFREEVKKNGLVFAMPSQFKEIAVVPNDDVKFDYAIKAEKTNFEVRYDLRLDLHGQLQGMALATAFNIAGTKKIKSMRSFKTEDVKSEFGADRGYAVFMDKMDSDFGRGYQNCMCVALEKDGVGQIYIFFLFDNIKKQEALFNSAFHSLKFSPGP